jgi:hypothetical protein
MIQWWGASNAASRTAEADVRVGGRFHVGFRGNDGGQHDVSGGLPRGRAGRETDVQLGVAHNAGA